MRPTKGAAVEVEIHPGTDDLDIRAKESRRGKSRWTLSVSPDGSAKVFVGENVIILPPNSGGNFADYTGYTSSGNQIPLGKISFFCDVVQSAGQRPLKP